MSEWIKWDGGDCPVPGGTPVVLRLRDGYEFEESFDSAEFRWRHTGAEDDIMEYRVMSSETPKPGPLTVEVRITDLEQFKGLLQAIRDNWDGLPAPVREACRKLGK